LFRRPLSDYWKAFRGVGFEVDDFDAASVTADRFHLAEDEAQLRRSLPRPYSVAFKLRRQA
jgi:hypothetical protein